MSTRGLLLAAVLVLAAGRAAAQTIESRVGPLDVSVGARAWYTTGTADWNFAGTFFGRPVGVLSDLRWRGTDALVTEVSADLVWRRLVLVAAYGRGDVDGGVLLDDDFSLDDRLGRFSHTRSGVEGDLWYASGDLGVRALRWGGERRRGWLDALVGYQYWHERYVAFGITGFLDGSPFGVPTLFSQGAPSSLKVITQDYDVQSVRVGGRLQAPLAGGLSLQARAFALPWSTFTLVDVHHLRTDLKHNPSFTSQARGGLGVQAAAGLACAWGGLSVEAGYEFWSVRSPRGDKTARTLTVGDLADRLNEISVERGGPYLGLRWRF